MHYTWKHFASDAAFVVVIGIILFYVNELIYEPFVDPYEFKTIAKVSEKYEQPIHFTFNWQTEDELQVGKNVTFSSEIRGLPYSQLDEPLKEISLQFDERQLNYWSYEGDTINNETFQKDSITFQPNWDEGVFSSDDVEIRFIVPTDVVLTFCDNNIPTCWNVTNVIHPAPHDLAVQIQTNRIALGLTFGLAAFSSAIVWSRLRPR